MRAQHRPNGRRLRCLRLHHYELRLLHRWLNFGSCILPFHFPFQRRIHASKPTLCPLFRRCNLAGGRRRRNAAPSIRPGGQVKGCERASCFSTDPSAARVPTGEKNIGGMLLPARIRQGHPSRRVAVPNKPRWHGGSLWRRDR